MKRRARKVLLGVDISIGKNVSNSLVHVKTPIYALKGLSY